MRIMVYSCISLHPIKQSINSFLIFVERIVRRCKYVAKFAVVGKIVARSKRFVYGNHLFADICKNCCLIHHFHTKSR